MEKTRSCYSLMIQRSHWIDDIYHDHVNLVVFIVVLCSVTRHVSVSSAMNSLPPSLYQRSALCSIYLGTWRDTNSVLYEPPLSNTTLTACTNTILTSPLLVLLPTLSVLHEWLLLPYTISLHKPLSLNKGTHLEW